MLGSVLGVGLASAGPTSYAGIVAFGDSLSDAGNIALATGGLFPGPNYSNGEFTNGPGTTPGTSSPTGIWLDQLAPKLGVSAAQPSLAGGTNFAVGGSETLQASGPGNLIPSLNTEVSAALLAGGGHASPNFLYSFWSGSNDILDNPGDLTIPAKAADDIYNEILALAAAGGKDFLWLNLPPLGDTPEVEALGAGAVALANTEATMFNTEMATDVLKLEGAGINVVSVDINSLFNHIMDDFNSGCSVGPSDPDCFANISSPAQGQAVDPNTYLYWDTLHPTTEGHELIADAAFAALTATPEPTSLTLGAAGLFSLLLLRKRQSRN